MSSPEADAGWFFAGVASVVASLAGAVAMLFKLLESKNAEMIIELRKNVDGLIKEMHESNLRYEEKLRISDAKHDECERDRLLISQEIAVLQQQIKSVQNQ